MESLSGLQIGCSRNVAAPELNLCGAAYGLAGLMSCSAMGTWICCIQGQVQKQFNCLSWHRARPNKHFEPKLALHRSILGVFGGIFALLEVLTHVMCREASGSPKWPEGLLIWAEFHFVELCMSPAESFSYQSPASCQMRRGWSPQGWCHLNAGLCLGWY